MLAILLLLQLATGRVDGTVTTDAGSPIAGAVVTVPALDRSAVTDDNGRFNLSGLPGGAWELSVAAIGFAPAAIRVEVAADRAVRIEIGLSPLAPGGDSPAVEVMALRADDGSPVDLVAVTLGDQTRSSVGGRAVFRGVAPGVYRLRARRIGFEPVDTAVSVAAEGSVIVMRLAPSPVHLPPLEVVAALTTRAATPMSAPGDLSAVLATGLARVGRREIVAIPPAFEPDVLRALQATPGVGAANDINAHPAIRGGAPEHTLFLLDGAPVLGPYHMFGLFGAFNPDAVEEAQILRGSLPARVGGALGSVVSLRSTRSDALRVTGGATVLASRVAASGPFGGAGSWLVAGRRTNLGFGEGGPFGIDMPYRFWDAQATVRVEPGRDQEITITGYGSGDEFVENLFFVGQGSAPLYSAWENRVASATWRLARSDGWGASVGAWRSEYRSTLAVGDTTLRADSAETRGSTRLGGLTVAIGRPLSRGELRMDLGVTVNRAALSGDSLAAGYFDDRVDRTLIEVSASAELEQRIGPATLAPGFRMTRWSAGSRWSFEPRLVARWESESGLRVTASATRTEQALFALRDDRLPLLGVPFWVLPSGAEPRAQATSVELALAGGTDRDWGFEASIFHRRLAGLPRWRPTGARNLESLEFDEGTITGLELSIARLTGRVSGWISYTPAVSVHRDRNGARYRPLWDRLHSIDAVVLTRLGDWGLVSGRFAMATGQPFWIEQGMFAGSEFDPFGGTVRARTDAEFPIWSSTQGRLPVYLRADLTASATRRIRGARVTVFAGATNLTGRRNVAGYRAQPGGFDGTIEYLPRNQLPRVPVLGVDVSFGAERDR